MAQYVPRKGFDQRNERSMALIRSILDDHEIDMRLTPGQMHQAAMEALGCEALIFACNLLRMAVDARSKITIHPVEAAKLALAINDRIYGPPDVKMRKKNDSENQFELDFAWQTSTGELHVKAEGEL